MQTFPPSPARSGSLTPGGSPAERLFDSLHRCERPPMCRRCQLATDQLARDLAREFVTAIDIGTSGVSL